MRLLPTGASRTGSASSVPRTVVADRSQFAVATAHRGRNSDVVEDARVLAQRDFGVGAAVDVVEDDARQPPLREAAEVGDVDDTR